ncbi:hypothetical protein C1752_01159 [Acaryochloris thomasi RCC1774]|uniref:Uncharacterized protein n=1 Tax=Acaryochloris thomasi RCC1774 TaxID=1764569 RepID=A0A2W1JM39_9CYAN|nr:hypothetical protein [Acaryochloris thomasi]PZD74276.1 hypothetical protein C1752_01159 [Acaryochloris thomasi RCC1774]
MSPRRIPPSRRPRRPDPPLLDAEAGRTLAIGFVLALIILASPQLTFILSPLVTLVHEFGHAAISWLFGYPAIPSFDFVHGGGITLQANERFTPILFLLYSAWGYGLYRFRSEVRLSQILLSIGVVYTLFAFTGLQETLMVSMGHGFELGFAGLFLYRALSGAACRMAAERPVYGMLASYIFLYDLKFAHNLLFDPEIRQIYIQGKGGVLDHDFVRLAHGPAGLSGVVTLFILACLATPLLVFWFYYSRQTMQRS